MTGGGELCSSVPPCPQPLSASDVASTLLSSQAPLVRSRWTSVNHSRASMAAVAVTTQAALFASACRVSKDTGVKPTLRSAESSRAEAGLRARAERTCERSFFILSLQLQNARNDMVLSQLQLRLFSSSRHRQKLSDEAAALSLSTLPQQRPLPGQPG